MPLQESRRLQDTLASFKAPRGLPAFNVLLCGGVGSGKSSLVSSIDSIFKSRISRRAPHGSETDGLPFTRTFTKYTFKAAGEPPTKNSTPETLLGEIPRSAQS